MEIQGVQCEHEVAFWELTSDHGVTVADLVTLVTSWGKTFLSGVCWNWLQKIHCYGKWMNECKQFTDSTNWLNQQTKCQPSHSKNYGNKIGSNTWKWIWLHIMRVTERIVLPHTDVLLKVIAYECGARRRESFMVSSFKEFLGIAIKKQLRCLDL